MNRCRNYLVAILIILFTLVASFSTTAQRSITANQRILDVLRDIESSLTDTKYSHVTRINRRTGKFHFDCSGMAVWVLKRSAPAALEALGRPNDRRPLAVHFYRKIASIPKGEKRGAWYHVPSAAHIKPGDIIAWQRPKWFPSNSTGHVAFAVGLPQSSQGEVQGILIRIADASKFQHEDDSRSNDTTGYGTGVLLLPTDRNAQPLGYGWIGSETPADWIIPCDLVIGRALR
ncbi:MAG: hypothetical protein JXX14_02155 [Deltaproteobacteria bacterium]|nr:hypothetical protein [Deltaproteobacteria bacterium]